MIFLTRISLKLWMIPWEPRNQHLSYYIHPKENTELRRSTRLILMYDISSYLTLERREITSIRKTIQQLQLPLSTENVTHVTTNVHFDDYVTVLCLTGLVLNNQNQIWFLRPQSSWTEWTVISEWYLRAHIINVLINEISQIILTKCSRVWCNLKGSSVNIFADK